MCKLAKYVRNCVVFWGNLQSGRDKFQVWLLYVQCLAWCLCLAQCQCPVSGCSAHKLGSCLIHGVNKTAGKTSYMTEQTCPWLVRTRQGYFQAFFSQSLKMSLSCIWKCLCLLLWLCHVSSSLWSTVCMIKHLLGCSRVTSAVKTFFSKSIILIKLKPSTTRGFFPNWQNDGVDNGLRDCDEKVPMCPWLLFQQGLLGNRAKFHKGLRTRPLATPSAPQP